MSITNNPDGDAEAVQEFANLSSGTGFLSGVLIYKGELRNISIQKSNGTEAFYWDNGREIGKGWKMLRISRYVKPNEEYVFRFGVKNKLLVGGITMTAGAISYYPQTAKNIVETGSNKLMIDGAVEIISTRIDYSKQFVAVPRLSLTINALEPWIYCVKSSSTSGAVVELQRLMPGPAAEVKLDWRAEN